jgi:epoxyqueuosine reductase
MGNWVYGCDICQVVCPFNRFAPESDEVRFRPSSYDTAAPPLLDLLALDEAGFQQRFANSPIKRIKRTRLVRNACVAAGNWGNNAAIEPLLKLLSDPEPLVRGHAAWALGRIGGEEVGGVLSAVLEGEMDARVQKEIQNALNYVTVT